jgi:hypothetical protein
MDEEVGRSGASIIITTALIAALSKAAPEVLAGVIQQLEQAQRELAATEIRRATIREAAEYLAGPGSDAQHGWRMVRRQLLSGGQACSDSP